MIKNTYAIIVLLFTCTFVWSQNRITGTFPGLAGQQVKLVGFNGFNTYVIDSVKVNGKGVFNLSYSNKNRGMGYLSARDNTPFLVVLSGETIKLSGETLDIPAGITILEGTENKIFEQYASEHRSREQCLGAWDYLTKMYRFDTLFSTHEVPKQAIETEKKRIKAEDSLFLARLPTDSYLSYYLPVRKLIRSVSAIAQYRTEEIPAAFTAFRNMDYTDPRLYKSGLLKDVINNHFWLMENSSRPLDSVYIEMQISIDRMLENVMADKQKLNEIAAHLFTLLEQRSLFPASEYLAIRLLNMNSCTLNNDFAAQLESYRAMKKGNIAPDINFTGDVFAPDYENENKPKKLSDIQSVYKVVVFGAGWCPQCPVELQSIAQNYGKWKQYGVEVFFISLDEDKQTFTNFTQPFAFISTSDYKKWDSPAVKDYHVFATPTIYLLNNNHEIILKPGSVRQLDSWIDRYLVKGNK